jgi:predicted acylesterase/phospholipase RssA
MEGKTHESASEMNRNSSMLGLKSIGFTTLYITLALMSPIQINAFVQSDLRYTPRRMPGHELAVSTAPSGGSGDLSEKPSKRARVLNRMGFKRLSREQKEIQKAKESHLPPAANETYEVKTLDELESYFDDKQGRFRDKNGKINYDRLLRSLSVSGDTQVIGSTEHLDYVHPVAKLLHERKRNQSQCTEGGTRADGCKIAMVIEGGGMRGCVSAGMVGALHHLGLRDAVDIIYGSSAGSIVGAYFITEQLPWFGPELYYDKLTTAGKEFIDTRRLLRVLGFGLADPRLLKDVLTRPNNGKPVLNLSFLLEDTMQRSKPLDWEKFSERQKVQPLKVVASGLKSEKAVVMDMANGHFDSLEELSQCMRASCLLPGIAGPVMNMKIKGENNDKPNFFVQNGVQDPDYEPLGDALVYGPIPYESAYEDGATHVIVLRSRPDGADVTGKGGVFERMIFRRFFMRKNKLPGVFKQMSQQLHKKLYAKNIIELNEAAYSERDYKDTSKPHTLTLALAPGSEEITRLETGREEIFEGVRRGFARAYDALVEDPAERGRGHIVAKEYFPDEIMDYNPTDITGVDDSAFGIFMKENAVSPKSWAHR